ncbi:16S rRNA (guanine(527)-N(7))-methyltransferase RsmG [Sphingomonas solaris]|uniref:Ribosomal RNA small subunit methyltransferase G n=1 Tax=Alterirhizorhabdus solaris TaxID=2529389 RepID=A0A558R3H2_9SPHN|nr:16S rRNA (guanine(527)-N(7))-methyltransferase RsmG [Sphingomonas solaris]TVV73902.1 16S rRNA (guanine(527)-N(7))-methyltransferase RsmG [Sphingomonas solaris]
MTEDDARRWIADRVPRETFDLIEQFVALVVAEAGQQNLISAATIETIWNRHVVDSAQLLDLAPPAGRWIDLGAGAGFPGMVVGLVGRHQVSLAESRAKRIAFLREAIDTSGMGDRIDVLPGRIEMLPAEPFDVISARAFAPLDRLFSSALHLSSRRTRWVLPKGRGAQAELDAVRGSWQGDFSIVPSITDADAAIIVAENVRPAVGHRKTGSRR